MVAAATARATSHGWSFENDARPTRDESGRKEINLLWNSLIKRM
jgi:hypothetical protein